MAGTMWRNIAGAASLKANDWTSGFQDPFGSFLSSVNDPIVAAKQAGTLTYDQANAALTSFNQEWSAFDAAAQQFKAKGGDYATVIDQSYNPNQAFMQTVNNVRNFLTSTVADLKPTDSSTDPTKTGGGDAPTLLTTTQQTGGGQTPAQAAAAAAERTKDASIGGGRSSTILTGPQGLTMLTGLQRQAKTLLGYSGK